MTVSAPARWLHLDLRSFFHVGTGGAGKNDTDKATRRDANGFPMVPGKSLKRSLRAASLALEGYGDFAPRTTELLFGTDRLADDELGQAVPDRIMDYPSSLRISSAMVPDSLHLELDPAEVGRFFRRISSTAIDVAGVAQHGSLRSVEVGVPATLVSLIEWLPRDAWVAYPDELERLAADLEGSWVDILEWTIRFVRSAGGGKSSGLGRCTMSLELAE